MIGKNISHYRIIEKLGEGGMGVVYKAEDTKLKRTVALKFLPPDLTRDKEAKKRFIHEAQAASALDHHNICTIHEIDETQDAQTFIVMTCYNGETLKDKIQDKGKETSCLPVKQAIDIAIQIAQGLDKAHKKGIVHRDIKPANIFITEDGVAKILDFGLAKLGTQTKLTRKGTTLGTVAYMSPEQTRGEGVDDRTDIWSLGVVLYEMITGQLPFKGDYEQAVIYSILNETYKSIKDLCPGVPTDLEEVVNKALSKSLDERYRQTREMLADLRSVGKVSDLPQGTKKFSKVRLTFMLVIFTITFLFTFLMISLITCPKVRELHIQRTIPLTTASGLEQDPTWSPEGTRIAYASDEHGNMDVWMQQIAAGQRINLSKNYTGYDGKPAWSPDGEWIAFISDRDGGGIFVMPALGGMPRRVVSLSFASSLSRTRRLPAVCWSPDGTELAYTSKGILYTVPASGGPPKPVSLPSTGFQVGYSEPAWSHDGERIACTGIVASGVSTSQIWSVQHDGSDPVLITEGKHFDHNPVWSPDGRYLFFISDRGGNHDVWWLSVDARGKPTGQARALTAGVGVGAISLSIDGTKIAYTKVVEHSNIWSTPIVSDRKITLDDALAVTSENQYVERIRVSPDGEWIAFDSNRSGNQDIWIMRKDGSELRQLTTNTAHDWLGSWSPDGKQIAFHSLRSGNRDVYIIPVAGGAVTPLTSHPAEDGDPVWSPDGERITFLSNRNGNLDIWLIPSTGGEAQQLNLHETAAAVRWSPDGKRLVFNSNRTGNFELFLIPSEGGDPVQLTNGMWLGIGPQYWSADGQTIYAWGFGGPGNEGVNLWSVSVADGSARSLMDLRGSLKEPFGLSSDGERFFFILWERIGDLWMAELSTGKR